MPMCRRREEHDAGIRAGEGVDRSCGGEGTREGEACPSEEGGHPSPADREETGARAANSSSSREP